MTAFVADVALLTESRYTAKVAAPGDWYQGNILADDNSLREGLRRRGLTSQRVDWADPEVDWSQFRLAVFRTTWDYFDRFPEFSRWLERVETQTALCNSSELVWWNLDKHYLADLQSKGVRTVPCRFVERGSEVALAALLEETGWDEAVIKPCVSGTARHTYRVNRQTAAEVEAKLRPLVAEEAFILQPFQQNIVRDGEDTLMVFDGRYSHAVKKRPKPGDFRVQDDHGGTVSQLEPSPEQIAFAEQAMRTCVTTPLYGRVDMVRDNEGAWAVMELELIEPELWLRNHPPAAEAFAEGIARQLQR